MPRKSTPFKVVVHFTGKKNNQDIQSLVDDFYISQIQMRLNESDLTYDAKISIVDRLISQHAVNP